MSEPIPVLQGVKHFAEAEAFGAEPTPASFEYKPLLIPYTIHEPATPPRIDWKSNASWKIKRNIAGTF